MKNIKAFTIVLIVWMIGELLSKLIDGIIIIPGSIIGFLLLFLALKLKIIKYETVKDLAEFFMKHIVLLLIPVAISFIGYFSLIGANIIPILICGILITIITLTLTMKFIDVLVNISERKKGEENE